MNVYNVTATEWAENGNVRTETETVAAESKPEAVSVALQRWRNRYKREDIDVEFIWDRRRTCEERSQAATSRATWVGDLRRVRHDPSCDCIRNAWFLGKRP